MAGMMRRSPVRVTLGLALGMALVLTAAMGISLNFEVEWAPWLLAWLVAINVVTFVFYGWDKRQAGVGGWRVPEITLHALVVVGGTLGAIAAMRVFRHKTVKTRFRIVFWLLVALQVALLAWGAKELWTK